MEKTCSVPGCSRPGNRLGFCTPHYCRNRRHGSPTGGTTGRGEAIDFLRAAAASDTDDCILWPFSVGVEGYGQTNIAGKKYTAHRAALMLATGLDPDRRVHAAHDPARCSDRRCVNPKHLRWASPVDNEADKVVTGTIAKGARNGNAVFTDEQVRVIRGLRTEHWKIAAAFDVSLGCIDALMAGRTY